MAKITYHTHDSKTHTIDVQNGLTVMEGAVQNDIPGIDADCGVLHRAHRGLARVRHAAVVWRAV